MTPTPSLEIAIRSRAARCGLELPDTAIETLAEHARAVMGADRTLHLTSITDAAEFVERHIGESLEGAALLDDDIDGALIDLGSGNGYPALPVTIARPGLRPLLVEASARKAKFLRAVLADGRFEGADVLPRQVQRAGDLPGTGPVRLITTRAMGGWEKIVPRVARALADDGRILLWTGADAEVVLERQVWRRFEIMTRHTIPGRERSWIWLLRPRLSRDTQNSPLR